MATRTNLDLDTLRTLVVAHDLGGLAQAADRLGRTPSAISLQMKRLQDDLETELFRKRGRGLVLTEAGEVALTYARRILAMHDELLDTIHGGSLAGNIRIGCPQDFASFLPSVLSQFNTLYVQAALIGGLGITARTSFNLSEGLRFAASLYGLPLLGSLPVSLHRNAHLIGDAADRMATLLLEALKFILAPRSKSEIPRKRHNGLAGVAAAGVAMHKPRSRVR